MFHLLYACNPEQNGTISLFGLECLATTDLRKAKGLKQLKRHHVFGKQKETWQNPNLLIINVSFSRTLKTEIKRNMSIHANNTHITNGT